MANRVRRISRKKAKHKLTTIGLAFIVYILFVLIVPHALKMFLEIYDPIFVSDEYLYIGIYLIVLVFGSFIPFIMLKSITKIKNNRIFGKVNATFVDLFVQAIVCIATCTALTYVSNMLLNSFGFQSQLISSIGLNYQEAYLENYLYIFMLVVVTPIIEEFVFRGVLLNCLGEFGKVFSLYTSAILFALCHSSIGEILPAFAMGVILGKVSFRYKSIQPTTFIHILFNLFIYGLCVLPESISSYMAYGIAGICVLALYLVLTGHYRSVKMAKSSFTPTSFNLFFTRPTTIISLLLLIVNLFIKAYLK